MKPNIICPQCKKAMPEQQYIPHFKTQHPKEWKQAQAGSIFISFTPRH